MRKVSIDLGPCCKCGHRGPRVRNIVMLPKKTPVPGTGWGCVVCDLPRDGAMVVLCDRCVKSDTPPKFAVYGRADSRQRVPYESLTGVQEHLLAFHPERMGHDE